MFSVEKKFFRLVGMSEARYLSTMLSSTSTLSLRSLLLLLMATSTGCFLPLSTAAPQSARTLGQGQFGVTFYAEMPTLDLLASQTDAQDEEYAIAPFPTATAQIGVGVTDSLDIEAALDGQLWFYVLPLPLGGSLGARYQVLYNQDMAIAVAGRVGYVGFGVSEVDETTDVTETVSATYGVLTGVIQAMPDRVFRPSLAVSVIPASVKNEIINEAAENYGAVSTAATITLAIGAGPLEVGPFVNLVYFNSPNLSGTASFATGGVSIALRQQKKKKKSPAVAEPAPPGY